MVMDIKECDIRDMDMGCYQLQTKTVFLNDEITFIGNIRMAYNRKLHEYNQYRGSYAKFRNAHDKFR